MTAVDDLWTLQRARARGLLAGHEGYRFDVGTKGAFLVFNISIVPRNRLADGSIGKRRGQPVYFSAASPEKVLKEAARWVQRALPEVSQ